MLSSKATFSRELSPIHLSFVLIVHPISFFAVVTVVIIKTSQLLEVCFCCWVLSSVRGGLGCRPHRQVPASVGDQGLTEPRDRKGEVGSRQSDPASPASAVVRRSSGAPSCLGAPVPPCPARKLDVMLSKAPFKSALYGSQHIKGIPSLCSTVRSRTGGGSPRDRTASLHCPGKEPWSLPCLTLGTPHRQSKLYSSSAGSWGTQSVRARGHCESYRRIEEWATILESKLVFLLLVSQPKTFACCCCCSEKSSP